MPSVDAQSEPWPPPDWDALVWPQENDSHQTSQEYNWKEKVLYRGMVENPAITRNGLWRLLLPREGQPDIKYIGSHIFFFP